MQSMLNRRQARPARSPAALLKGGPVITNLLISTARVVRLTPTSLKLSGPPGGGCNGGVRGGGGEAGRGGARGGAAVPSSLTKSHATAGPKAAKTCADTHHATG
jgi:hypothetical protein